MSEKELLTFEERVAAERKRLRTRRRFINAAVRLWHWGHTWDPKYVDGWGVDEALWALGIPNVWDFDFEADELPSAMRSEAEVLP